MNHALKVDPKKTLILFDFDGTIADTLIQVVGILNKISGRFGYTLVDADNLQDYRENGGDSFFNAGIVKQLMLPLIVNEVIRQQGEDIELTHPFPDLKNVLTAIHRKGYRMGIVSSNGEENVRRFLIKHDMTYLFECIHSGGGLFGKDRVIERVMNDLRFMKGNVIYVGDEVRDIAAARNAGIRVISVAWGYHSHSALRKAKPDVLVDKPSQLLKVFRIGPWWTRLFW